MARVLIYKPLSALTTTCGRWARCACSEAILRYQLDCPLQIQPVSRCRLTFSGTAFGWGGSPWCVREGAAQRLDLGGNRQCAAQPLVVDYRALVHLRETVIGSVGQGSAVRPRLDMTGRVLGHLDVAVVCRNLIAVIISNASFTRSGGPRIFRFIFATRIKLTKSACLEWHRQHAEPAVVSGRRRGPRVGAF
nr:MAG TPA: hypothetical protein [Inoviridae sp.]